MTTFFKQTLIAAAVISFSGAVSANVLTSVKPLGFIASSIADGVTETSVLVPAGASPHDYSLKPSDVQKIKSADLIVWIGEDVDLFLDGAALKDIDSKKVLEISEIAAITEDMLQKGHDHDHDHAHEHDTHDHDDHDHDAHDHDAHDHDKHDDKDHDDDHLETNWHIWYSPQISQIVANQIANKLSAIYPDKKVLIEKNLADFNRTLSEQNMKIQQQLAPVKDKGFYVFHDAYSYFNQAYQLNQKGYFTINPLVAPGAKNLAKIKQEIQQHQVSCLFAEPQFTPKVIESLSKATGVKVGQLDPMGDKVSLGKQAYANFLQSTADSYFSCLK